MPEFASFAYHDFRRPEKVQTCRSGVLGGVGRGRGETGIGWKVGRVQMSPAVVLWYKKYVSGSGRILKPHPRQMTPEETADYYRIMNNLQTAYGQPANYT